MSVQQNKSTVIISVEFKSYLDITFKGGKKYRYHNVPDFIHQEFLESDSKGKFFRENIRDKYKCTELPSLE